MFWNSVFPCVSVSLLQLVYLCLCFAGRLCVCVCVWVCVWVCVCVSLSLSLALALALKPSTLTPTLTLRLRVRLQARLRAQFIEQLRTGRLDGGAAAGVSSAAAPESLHDRVLLSAVAEFLHSRRLAMSASVFLPETGLKPAAAMDPHELRSLLGVAPPSSGEREVRLELPVALCLSLSTLKLLWGCSARHPCLKRLWLPGWRRRRPTTSRAKRNLPQNRPR